MQIAAILSLPEASAVGEFSSPSATSSAVLGSKSIAKLDILGRSLLDRTLSKVERLGIVGRTIISQVAGIELFPSRAAAPSEFVATWEEAVARYVREGVDALLLVRVGTYTDLDYAQFLKFHSEAQSVVTQAYSADGALDIALIDASALRNAEGAYRRALSGVIPHQRKFSYRGYVNRLASPQDFYRLVEDGLRGRCSLRPVGSETRDWVWQGEDCEIDSSAVIGGPAFIGAGTHIGAGCVIGAGTAIERDCEVDCGTTVESSWVLERTYLGIALDVRRSVINTGRLFHLDRNLEVEIEDHQLIGEAGARSPLLSELGSMIWG